MSKLRDAIFAKARERGLSDEETQYLFKAVDEALEQFVGQPKTTELMLRVSVVGTAAIDQAFIEIEKKREQVALERLGPPDEVDTALRLRSRAWVCSSCRERVVADAPITNPAPCARCGGIAFEIDRPTGEKLEEGENVSA